MDILDSIEHVSFQWIFIILDEACGSVDEPETSKNSKKPVPNGVDYFCPVCKETLSLTPIDMLKHKKSHS